VGEERKLRRGTLLGARAAGRRRHQGKGSSAAAAAPPESPDGGAREGRPKSFMRRSIVLNQLLEFVAKAYM
jgi:hypothetical protein